MMLRTANREPRTANREPRTANREPLRLLTAVAVVAVIAILAATRPQSQNLGYDNTPMLPNSPWRVHDGKRPQPPVVEPAPAGVPVPAPADAVVLFDGTDLSTWRGPGGRPAGWRVEDGAMVVVARTGSITSTESFGDVQLHIEWATPAEVAGEGQGRGNSGVFLMRRYEIQVLDSFRNPTYPDGQAGAIYGQVPPVVNASRGPGEWQSFDIVFTAPRFADGQVASPARATMFHNGVLVHHAAELIGSTLHQKVGVYEVHPEQEPIVLQDHGNPVRFRNIWARRLTDGDVR
jgi:hypothetical protein